jgi:cytochrome c oxidase subunit IV
LNFITNLSSALLHATGKWGHWVMNGHVYCRGVWDIITAYFQIRFIWMVFMEICRRRLYLVMQIIVPGVLYRLLKTALMLLSQFVNITSDSRRLGTLLGNSSQLILDINFTTSRKKQFDEVWNSFLALHMCDHFNITGFSSNIILDLVMIKINSVVSQQWRLMYLIWVHPLFIYSDIANKTGFQVVPNFIGHGIGSYFHGPPDILHFSKFLL